MSASAQGGALNSLSHCFCEVNECVGLWGKAVRGMGV